MIFYETGGLLRHLVHWSPERVLWRKISKRRKTKKRMINLMTDSKMMTTKRFVFYLPVDNLLVFFSLPLLLSSWILCIVNIGFLVFYRNIFWI